MGGAGADDGIEAEQTEATILARGSRCDRTYARQLLQTVCALAGPPSFVADLRIDLARRGLLGAIEAHDSGPLFGWLLEILSYQGIADAVAAGYMERHGT